MSNRETNVKNSILLALGQRPDVYIQNNPTGVFRAMDDPKRIVRVGNPGQSDLLAVVAVEITPDMVGKTIGAACFIEVKTEAGRQSDAQRLFQAAVERRGAQYALVRSPNEAISAISRLFEPT